MIMNMFVHTAHHRAQCEVYLRAKGIKPPDYTFELRRGSLKSHCSRRDSLSGCPGQAVASPGFRGLGRTRYGPTLLA